jgi:phage terminase small subunit
MAKTKRPTGRRKAPAGAKKKAPPKPRVRRTDDVARATPLAQLTGKRRTFAQEYVLDHNATKAAERAGYSAKTAAQQGYRLLRNVHVAAAVAWLEERIAEKNLVTADRVLRELLILLDSDVRHFLVDNDGQLQLAAGAPDTAWRAVSSVKHKTTTYGNGERETTVHEVEFRLWDKPAAARMLGEHLGLFPHKIDLSDVTKLTDEELAARRKALGLK